LLACSRRCATHGKLPEFAVSSFLVNGTEATVSAHPPILIVDDEEIVRSALSDILELYGYSAVTAGDASAAFQIFPVLCAQPGVHLVILDLMMPGLNGLETMHRLAALDPDAQFIISSGFDRDEIAARFHFVSDEGSKVHFLQKPYSMSALATLVEQCFSGAAA